MKKIPTLFQRDETRRYVTDVVTPGCEWVLAGEGRATPRGVARHGVARCGRAGPGKGYPGGGGAIPPPPTPQRCGHGMAGQGTARRG
jgi:hypothetical protein